jgi:DNA-binding CsgD family transcriptional regulator
MQLAEGVSLDDIAERRDITRNTAKSQLHSVFAKTGTSRQSELVSMVLRSAAGISVE